MLLTKKVKVKWDSRTRKHYEKKGYVFTKPGDEFEIKVEDLTDGSKAKVEVKCDCIDCKNPYLKSVVWKNYVRCVKEDGKYYCRKCSMKLFGEENMIKTKLENSISFEQWCMDNNRQDALDRWDYELNHYKPSEIGYGSAKKFYFKCPMGIHKSELKCIGSFTSGQEGSIYCNQCNSFAQYLIDKYGDNALELYWDYDKNDNIDPFKIPKGWNNKVWIKCQDTDYHGSYHTDCNSFSSVGCRCPYCSHKKGNVHPKDSLGQYLEDNNLLYLWSDKNEKSPYEYTPKSKKHAWFRCPDGKHNDTYRVIGNTVNYDFRCPKCVEERDESILQENVRLYLESLNMGEILHENKCTIFPRNPKTNYFLPYDNEVKELKLIIEVHGIQHYKLSTFHILSAKKHGTTPEYELHMQQVRDRYKRMYVKSKGYNYLEIPYTANNKQKTYKKLIDNKIQEILKLSE